MSNEDIARMNDQRILKLATYASTHWTTKRVNSVAQIFLKFAELKRLVKSGEFKSIEDLEQSIYARYGIMGNSVDMGDLSAMMDEVKKDMDRYEKRKNG
jgi:hypothetical protein